MFFDLNISWHISQEFPSGAGTSSFFWPLVLADGPAAAKGGLWEDVAREAAE